MISSELRIGNLVRSDLQFDGNIIEKCRFNNDIFRVTKQFICHDFADLCEGVKLSREWLDRFGFEKDGKSLMNLSISNDLFLQYSVLNTDMYCSIISTQDGLDHNGDEICQYVNITIPESQYVHQLQNIYFALTGSELEIKENAHTK